MKTLILYHSEHHGNTKKIADVIAKTLGAETVPASGFHFSSIDEYDLIGFGSGIYYSRFHDSLYRVVESLPAQNGKKAFLFSTTGSKTYSMCAHESFKALLADKGFAISGEFSCLGFDTALSEEGINRGKPDAADLKAAERFAKGLIK
ncbi:MAG: flavodoxin [Spirochaetes bacterium]|nr:flavodoxin [Spirochaetota bacterium]